MTGAEIRALRTRYGVSRRMFGEMIGVTVVSVERWEYEDRQPHKESLRRLERLKLPLEQLDTLTPQRLAAFMINPHPGFDGVPPSDLVKSDYSFALLLRVVSAAKEKQND